MTTKDVPTRKIRLEQDIVNEHRLYRQRPNVANDLGNARAILQRCNEAGDCVYVDDAYSLVVVAAFTT